MNDDQPHGDDEREGHPDTRPYLCVPYWSSPVPGGGSWDTGEVRPLPGAVVSWLCDSVHAGPYRPGEPLDVSVDVRNSGGGNSASIATVVVYWSDPTVGFAKPRFFAASVVAVPPSRTTPASTSTPTMTAVIPASAPAHICLLVAVSHAQDRAGTTCDPVGDRHWAQRNLQAAPVAPGAPALLPFLVANPFDRETALELRVGPAEWEHAELIAANLGMEPNDMQPLLRLLDADGAQIAEEGRWVWAPMDMGPLEERRLQVLVEVDGEVSPGQSVALEAVMVDRREEEGRAVGSLGLVLLSPDDR